jgi:DNA repair protein RadC
MSNYIKHFELHVTRRNVAEDGAPYIVVRDPNSVAEIVRRLSAKTDREAFYVFLLDIKNKIIGFSCVGIGAVDACPVDPREVFRTAVLHGASGIIAAHNHPSGDCTPSTPDKQLTVRLGEAAKLLGIAFLDHVVVSSSAEYSFAQHGEV